MQDKSTELSRAAVEEFLYREAELIDTWQLEEWASLFSEDGEYLIPPLDAPDGEPGRTLFLVYDDRHRLSERARRLMKRQAHAEFPRSRVRHIVSNVKVTGAVDGCTRVTCNFVVYRSRLGDTEVFPGHAVYDLRASASGLLIRRKRATLDTDSLRDQGRISIIL